MTMDTIEEFVGEVGESIPCTVDYSDKLRTFRIGICQICRADPR